MAEEESLPGPLSEAPVSEGPAVEIPLSRARRDEYLLRAAFIVSTTGDWVFRFALPLLVLKLTGSALSTAFTYAIEFIPYIVVGLISGVVADRVDRRRLMIWCNFASSAIMGCIAVLCAFGDPPVAVVFVTAFVLSCVRPFYFPAFQGFLVDRVPPARRPTMNAWVQGADSMLNLLGPVLGVGIVTLMGPAIASAVNAVSFGAAALLVAGTFVVVDHTAPPSMALRAAFRRLRPDVATGFRLLFGDPALRAGTILLIVTNFAVLGVEANLVFIIAGPGASDSFQLALVFGAQGAGAVVGAAIAPALLRRMSEGTLLTMGMAAMAVALTAPALSLALPVLTVAWCIAGLSSSVIVVSWFTYRQRVIEAEFMGRVVAVNRVVSFAAIPLGAVAGGWLLSQSNARTLFAVAGALQVAVWLGTRMSAVGRAAGALPVAPVAPGNSDPAS